MYDGSRLAGEGVTPLCGWSRLICMAKFGLFEGAVQNPLQTFEGDYLEQNGAFVKVFENSKHSNVVDPQVGAVHLEPGQSVRKL